MIRLHAFCKFLYGDIVTSTRRAFFVIVAGHTAEFFVINQLFDIGVRSAHAAIGILLEFDKIKGHIERIVQKQLADQWLTNTEQNFQSLRSLERANGARQHTQHTTLRTRRDKSWRWRFGEETAIAGSFLGVEYAHLSIKAIDGSGHIRLAEEHGYTLGEITRREVIGTIEDDVIVRG